MCILRRREVSTRTRTRRDALRGQAAAVPHVSLILIWKKILDDSMIQRIVVRLCRRL